MEEEKQPQDPTRCEIIQEQPQRLIDMDFDSARRVKWEAGQLSYGPLLTLDPLDELFGELVDGVNYANVLQQDPRLTMYARMAVQTLSEQLTSMAQTLQIIRINVTAPHQPIEYPFK